MALLLWLGGPPPQGALRKTEVGAQRRSEDGTPRWTEGLPPQVGYAILCEGGELILEGYPVDLRRWPPLLAGGGELVLQGGPVGLRTTRRLVAGGGQLTLEGYPVTLVAAIATQTGTLTLRAIPRTLNRLTVSRTLTLTTIPRTLRGREP
jgi:hypothetical protein